MPVAAPTVPFAPELVDFIRRVLSVAETDKAVWDPSAVYKYNDGPGETPQWTLSIGFTEMGSNLKAVLERYIELGGTLAVQFAPYLAIMGETHIADPEFKKLLQQAGKEPAMVQAQHEIFDQKYLGPAFEWAKRFGFTEPLSFLVIADSYLHSGSMLPFLMNRFPEKRPVDGGNEKAWIEAYLKARRNWLAAHSNRILRGTVYRCDCYNREIGRDNWSLALAPISMHGTEVTMA